MQAMKQKVETLQADLSRRQESYIRRERAFNMRIEELEEEVGSLKVRFPARLPPAVHWQTSGDSADKKSITSCVPIRRLNRHMATQVSPSSFNISRPAYVVRTRRPEAPSVGIPHTMDK